MPGEYDLWFRQSPGSCRHDGVVARDVRVNDIEFVFFESRSQPQRGDEVGGIQEWELDLRLQRTAMPAGNRNIVTAFSKMFGQFDDVCFSATPGRGRTNLQNPHCELQNRR